MHHKNDFHITYCVYVRTYTISSTYTPIHVHVYTCNYVIQFVKTILVVYNKCLSLMLRGLMSHISDI